MRLFDRPEPQSNLGGAQVSDDLTEFTETFTYEYVCDEIGNLLSDEAPLPARASEPAETCCEVVIYDAFGNRIDEVRVSEDAAYVGRYSYEPRLYPIASDEAFYQSNVRCYDSTTGRWLNHDALGFEAGDTNPYRYFEPGR